MCAYKLIEMKIKVKKTKRETRKDFMCFLVFFLIVLPLSFVSSKILVYNTKIKN